jgi:hypothetical protein
MGLLTWLFGAKRSTDNLDQTRSVRLRLDDWTVHIEGTSFVGRYAKSPNGRYTLIWRDGNDEGTCGGARESGHGRYMLIDGDNIRCEGRTERPNDGLVSDIGLFILNDWHFTTGELKGTFCAFRPNGDELIRRRFNANLLNSGLARDGTHAVCQTCNSDDPDDSAVLVVFDLEAGEELFRWRAESGWAKGYEFSDDGSRIVLIYPEGRKYAYSLSGDFLDRSLWIDDALGRGDLHTIGHVMREAGSGLNPDLAKRMVSAIDIGLLSVRDDDISTRSYALRLKGECLDGLGQFEAALGVYEMALRIDPKIGVKRRAEKIRKMLAR